MKSLVIGIAFLLACLPSELKAQTPRLISYQGVLADSLGHPKPDGLYGFSFDLYDASAGGSPLWTEKVDLMVLRGLFSVHLGATTPFGTNVAFDRPYWLGVSVGTDAEIVPRILLTSVGYSFRAARADTASYALNAPPQPVADSAAVAATVSLPFHQSVTTPGLAFTIDNQGGSGIAVDAKSGTGISTYVYAPTSSSYGVYAEVEGPGGTGVLGHARALSGYSYGIFGISESTTGYGGFFDSFGTSGSAYGVYARSFSTSGYGIYGMAQASSGTNYGVYGKTNSPSGYAGYFEGNVHVAGTLTKSAGTFKIDHPLDPANKTLSHSFVESPDMLNIYNGAVTLGSDGTAWVDLPEWFEALNKDLQYQLTCIGAFAPVYVASEVDRHRFMIAGGTEGLKVSWQVTGVRKDAYAERHRVKVEESKPEGERGSYLNPEAFGLPERSGVSAVRDRRPRSGDPEKRE